MRKIIILTLLCIATVVTATESSLVLKMKDGTTHSFPLASEPKIILSGLLIHFEGKDITASFSAYSVQEYTFDIVSDITTVESGHSYRLENNNLHIYGNSKSPISVYDAAGKIVDCNIIGDASHRTVCLSSLPVGLYLVKVNNITIKVRTK